MNDESSGERWSEAAFTQSYTGLNDSFATKQKFKLSMNINQSERHERKGRVTRLHSIIKAKSASDVLDCSERCRYLS
jgi:hypothetical protein